MKPCRVLFVCTGNICRSPTADGLLRHVIAQRGWSGRVVSDSAGTHGYHVGHAPDPRTIDVAAKYGVALEALRARRVDITDFNDFDFVLAMDRGHLDSLLAQRPADCSARVQLFSDFYAQPDAGLPDGIPDPYYGGPDGFEQFYRFIENGVSGLVKVIEKEYLTSVS